MKSPAIQWDDVNYSVPSGFWMRSQKIIEHFSLSVEKGEVIGLIGANGAGKTTAIKLGTGLLKPDSGAVRINGKPVAAREARSAIGLLTENQYVYPYLKLKEWLRLLGSLSGMSNPTLDDKIEIILEKVGLIEKKEVFMRSLSKGQTQRAGIAQAILHSPEILFLDEPMSGLDPMWRGRIQDLLIDYKKEGGTILFSSHILADVVQISDRIAVIRSGQMAWSGRLDELPENRGNYQAVFFSDRINDLLELIKPDSLVQQADKSWVITIDVSQKNNLIDLAGSGKISLESLTPVYMNVEEILS